MQEKYLILGNLLQLTRVALISRKMHEEMSKEAALMARPTGKSHISGYEMKEEQEKTITFWYWTGILLGLRTRSNNAC